MSWPMPIGSSLYCIDRRLGYKKSCIEWDTLLTRYIGPCLPSTHAIRFLVAYTKPRCAFNRTLFISSCRACRPMRIALRIRLPTPCSVKTKSPYSCRYLCQIFTDFQNSFSVWFSNKFADYYPTTPRICRHTTPWNINTRKQAINDKLQVRVVTYIRFGDANKQFKKYLFLSLSEEILKISWEKNRVTAMSLD